MAVSQSYESRELHSQISDIHYDIRLICKMGVIYKMGAEVCTCTGFLQVITAAGVVIRATGFQISKIGSPSGWDDGEDS